MYKKFFALLVLGAFSSSYAMIGNVVGAATGAAQGALGIGEAAVGTTTGTVSRVLEPSAIEPAPAAITDVPAATVEQIDEIPVMETTGRDLIVEEDTTPAVEDVDLTIDTDQDRATPNEGALQAQDIETEMPSVSDADELGTDLSSTDVSGTDVSGTDVSGAEDMPATDESSTDASATGTY